MPNGSIRRRAATLIAVLAAVAIGTIEAAAWTPLAGTQASPSIGTHADARAPMVAAVAVRDTGPSRPTASTIVFGGAAVGALTSGDAAAGQSHGPDLRSHPAAPGTYSGRNHMWIPSLGMSRPVHLFPCSRRREPDNLMYRWGCAGANNVYLLGHAYGVMKPLHDAYYSGRLQVGMLAFYADGNGHIRAYAVTEWRIVDPVDSGWAIASQPVPSMTLQTCVGPKSSLRLNVRLVEVPL